MFLSNSSANIVTSTTTKCCEFYIKNNWCGYGSRCRFSHQLPPSHLVGYNALNPTATSFIPENSTQKSEDSSYQALLSFNQSDCKSEGAQNKAEPGQVEQPSNLLHAKQVLPCRYFERDSWCPFGHQCRFKHEAKQSIPSAPKPLKKPQQLRKNPKPPNGRGRSNDKHIPFNWRERNTDDESNIKNETQKICHYYLKKQCRNSTNCKFLHPNGGNAAREADSAIKLDAASSEKNAAQLSDVKENAVIRMPCLKPEYQLKDMNENTLKETRELEIMQMKKRIVKENLVELDDGKSFVVTINPTDPDWPYDINEVKLVIVYPNDYPKEMISIEINCEDNEELPLTLVRHMTDSINNWLKISFQQNQDAGKVELIFRPFLKWFDRNLEELFTCGLKKTKRHVEAKAAGIEFVPFNQLPGYKAEDVSSDIMLSNLNDAEIQEKLEHHDLDMVNNDLNKNVETTKDELAHTLINTIDLLQISKSGTEIRFCDFQIGENIASVVCQYLQISIKCDRCKTRHDIVAAPRRKNLISCTKCRENQYITFRPALIHSRSAVVGYLDLEHCHALDLPLVDATFSVTCLNCDKPRSAQGIHYGQKWNTWCYSCNVKLEIFVGSYKFQKLGVGNVAETGRVNVIKLENKDKKVKDPSIQEGKPLPSNGTCRHYKKSYRWFRFPCCGKAYPCDLCHNEKELEHEMKMANRVICGFCGKEQPFSNKPCTMCTSSMTQLSSGHWEGGKGCRDKVKMSRDDRQKYVGQTKTIAKSVRDRQQAVKANKCQS